MTMEEIDRRRGYLDEARKREKAARGNDPHGNARLAVVAEEESVLEALREWWAEEPIRIAARLAVEKEKGRGFVDDFEIVP